MAADIEVAIKSGSTVYNIFMNGNKSEEYTYSVAKYAKTILDSEDEKLASAKAVVKAMLNYGAAAQTYFEEKNNKPLGTLANVGYAYSAEELAAADFGTGTVTGATQGMTATLVLDTDTVIKIYKNGVCVGQSYGITADSLDDEATIVCSTGETVRVSVLTICKKVVEKSNNENYKNLVKALALYSAASEYYKANS